MGSSAKTIGGAALGGALGYYTGGWTGAAMGAIGGASAASAMTAKAPKAPELPKPPKEEKAQEMAPVIPSEADKRIRDAVQRARTAAALIGGRDSNIRTSPQGLVSREQERKKTLLGGSY